MNRDSSLIRAKEEVFDIAIIGGGITGAGVARDAASRGMKVCLVEQNDFASGTSSRSSKLIHGGIRYLENLEFHLVFEALNERQVLFNIAPHLVHPLTFILPIYKSSRVGMFKLGLGMWLYDALALFHTPKFHQRLSKGTLRSKLPSLQLTDLKGGYLYSDAYMDDDRLVIETLRSADSFGACLLNYSKVLNAKHDQTDRVTALQIEDQTTGKKFELKAKHFISTVGPWTDLVGESLVKDWQRLLRPSKGIHLCVPREKIPTESAIVMVTENDNRIIFAIPRGEIVIVGTTDTDFKEDPASVKTEHDDVTYLLKIVNDYFPGAALEESDIISSYAGVRPLVFDGSATESKTSREHVIKPTPYNVTFVAGGKYTTYRRMARDIVEVVLKNEFPLESRIQFARNQTRQPINSMVTKERLSEAFSQALVWNQNFKLDLPSCETLASRHGLEASEIIEQGMNKGLKSLWEMEALFAIKKTMCLHLRDFMLRRTPLYLTKKDHGLKILDKIAKVFADEYGWDTQTIEKEKQMYLDHIKTEMGWKS